MRPVLALLVLAVALAGCGNERTRPPDVSHPKAPVGERDVTLSAAGVAYTAPGNWGDLPAQDTRVGGIQSSFATVAIWRYPRAEPLPSGRAQLRQARDRLVAQVRQRQPQIRVRSARIIRRAGAPAIELVARQPVAGIQRDVRSTHVFRGGAEIVVDAYAPPAAFPRVDRTVFRPLLRSLKLRTPRPS